MVFIGSTPAFRGPRPQCDCGVAPPGSARLSCFPVSLSEFSDDVEKAPLIAEDEIP